MASPFSIKKNDAFLCLVESDKGTVQHAVFQIKDRFYYLSVHNDCTNDSLIIDCANERELVLTMHNIFMFAEVDMIYSFSGITDSHMKKLYARNGLNAWFWGSSMGRMFVCRSITMHGDLFEFGNACPEYEVPLHPIANIDLKTAPLFEIMDMLEMLSFYVKYHPLTYNEISRY